MLQNKDCRNCHSLDHSGGERGPALDGVATRLTVDQMVRQVIQGGGNMPAYGKNLKPAEVTSLAGFLETLRPDYEPAVRDAASGGRLLVHASMIRPRGFHGIRSLSDR